MKRLLRLTLSPLTSLSTLVVAFTPLQAQEVETQLLSAEGQVLTEEETVSRLEAVLVLNRALEEADKLLGAGDKLAARGRYEYAVSNSQPFGGTAEIHARAKAKLSNLLVLFGDEAAKKKDYPTARKHYEEALALQPDNAAAQAGLRSVASETRSISEQYPGNKAVSDVLLEKVTNIQKLIFEGDELYKSGQYQRSIARYQEVLRIDPYNNVARKRIEKTEKAKDRGATAQYQAQKVKAMADVEGNWSDPIPPRPKAALQIETERFVLEKSAALSQKLKEIIIPELNFTDVDVADAIGYLEEQSRALDREKIGVNFVLKTASSESAAPAVDGNNAATSPPSVNRSLTLSLRNVPLDEVLRFITNLTNLRYEVEEYAVYILPSTETSEILQVRTYSVPPKFFSLDLTSTPSTDAGVLERTVTTQTKDAKKELEEKGVTFPAGASAAYLPRTAKLVARNTLAQLNLIDQLLQRESGESKMVEVEAKFLEFTESKLKTFAANWRIDGFKAIDPITGIPIPGTASLLGPNLDPSNFDGTDTYLQGIGPSSSVDPGLLNPNTLGASELDAGGTSALRDSRSLPPNNLDRILGIGANRVPNTFNISAVVNGAGAQFLLTLLESQVGADLLSAPRTTIVDGQPAKLRAVRELIYPTEYEPPELPDTGGDGGSASTVIPATPSDFESRDVGVVLEVTANSSPDRRISLNIKPQVTEFQGFINYGQDAETLTSNGIIDTSTIPVTFIPGDTFVRERVVEGVSLQPVFSVREVETKIQVIDGQTVVMGGFIRDDQTEVEDKFPLLGDLPGIGRFFRSKSKENIKRNLVIFVTARLIKPDGTPKNLTEGEMDVMELTMDNPTPGTLNR
jgi:general secretion pathway protein D